MAPCALFSNPPLSTKARRERGRKAMEAGGQWKLRLCKAVNTTWALRLNSTIAASRCSSDLIWNSNTLRSRSDMNCGHVAAGAFLRATWIERKCRAKRLTPLSPALLSCLCTKRSTTREQPALLLAGRAIPILMITKLNLMFKTPRWRPIFCSLLLTAAAVAGLAAISSSRATDQGPSGAAAKVAPWVMDHTANGQKAEFIVVLADQADLSGAAMLHAKIDKTRFVHDALWNKAQTTQGPIVQWLRDRGIEHRSLYSVNALWVKGDRAVAEALAARLDVARVEGNPRIQNFPQDPAAIQIPSQPSAPNNIEPGVNYVHAPQVWALGHTGEGIVIASADTGVRWTHNALKPHYRGWDGSVADHDYNWHDSIHSGGGVCGPDSPQPCDDYFHGSH